MDSGTSTNDVLKAVDSVEGFFSEEQVVHLWHCARALAPGAAIVEIGSYRGRSAIVLALGARDATIVAVDPHAGNDRGPRQLEGTRAEGEADLAMFRANLARAGVDKAVRHVRQPSQLALDVIEGGVDLLFIDGAHRYRAARDDIARWGARVRPGGTLMIHDAFSSIGVTRAILRLLVPGGRFRYVGRTRSLAEYRREDLHWGTARPHNAARQAAELPWFLRNVAIKLALAARLRSVARLLGSEEWPY